MGDARVLVIGGGVAGCCCALRLASHGIDVHLAEKSVFPRAKVCGCCIGGAGLALLEKLSLRQWAQEHGVRTLKWNGSLGGQRLELKLPEGIAISRERLDSELLRRVAQAGVTLWNPASARVESLADDSVIATIEPAGGPTRIEPYRAVVIASGLNASGSHRLLPWVEEPSGPFGASFFAESNALDAETIYMACDDDGYVGMVRLEDNRVDIAAALMPGCTAAGAGSAKERIDGILMRSEFHEWRYEHPSPIMTTPPLRRIRQPGIGRLIAIGDAAGYVEPFTGEGMTWGMLSAVAGADLIATLARTGEWPTLGDRWNRRLPSLLRSRRLACRAVTGVLRFPLARRAIAATLSHWPGLAYPLIHHLNRL